MTAIASLSDLVNRLTGGNSGTPEMPFTWIDARVGAAAAQAPVGGKWSSLWQYNRSPLGGGAAAGAVAAPTRATQGALTFANPGGGRQKWLCGLSAIMGNGATASVLLYDRLLHIGTANGTVTTTQAVGGTITRNTAGIGNQIWIEIYTLIGTTATTITATYVNTANASKTTPAVAIGGTNLREPQRLIPLPLADGDLGVKSVTSVTLAATTGTAGAFGVTVIRPLAMIHLPAGGMGAPLDLIGEMPGIQELVTDSCLALAYLPINTAAAQLMLQLSMVEA